MVETIRVEVAYALPAQQFLRTVTLPPQATVRAAIEASGVLGLFPAIDLGVDRVGVWSRVSGLEARLRDGDRVEIYRSLQVDPKQVRRERAERAPLPRRR